jgi:hypothetical protein
MIQSKALALPVFRVRETHHQFNTSSCCDNNESQQLFFFPLHCPYSGVHAMPYNRSTD